MLPSETMIWQPEFTDKTLSRKTGAVQRNEHQSKTPKASLMTPEQIEIRELRKKLQRIEMENEILKNCPWVKPRPESQKLPGKVGRLI